MEYGHPAQIKEPDRQIGRVPLEVLCACRMNDAECSCFPLPPPDRVPALVELRLQVGASLLAAMADYALRAETLPHAQVIAALRALHAQLPARDAIVPTHQASAPRPAAGRLVANESEHDRYFHVCRISNPRSTDFVRGAVMAALVFHSEMSVHYGPADARRFEAVGLGLAALLGEIGGIRIAPVEQTATETFVPPPALDPGHRWVVGHQIFATLTQGLIFALQEFESAIHESNTPHARDSLELAADLLMASAAAFRFAADFPPSAYRDVIRPSMMAPNLGEGFSGLLSADHRQLVALLQRMRPLMADAGIRFAPQHKRLTVALNHVYNHHKFVCAEFDGAMKPSLRCPNGSSLTGVEQLHRFQRARGALLRSESGAVEIIE
jgi:hypothetical protein